MPPKQGKMNMLHSNDQMKMGDVWKVAQLKWKWGKWIQHPHYGTELCASQACVGFCPWWSLWYPPRVYYTCLIVTQLAAKLPNFITSQLKWHSCHCYLLPVWERKREREREREMRGKGRRQREQLTCKLAANPHPEVTWILAKHMSPRLAIPKIKRNGLYVTLSRAFKKKQNFHQ
jgi:hypothetical protein